MKALRVTNNGLLVDDIPIPEMRNETLVRVMASGICNTDLEIVKGYAGFRGTIGHEFVGVVERSSDKPEFVGRRVVGEINAGCGTCELCITGDERHCPKRTVVGIKGRDGSHAEYLMLPSRNLFAVPDNVPDRDAVFVEPFAAALGITEQIEVKPDTNIAVIGDGKLGLLCAFALSTRSNKVTLIGKHASKLQIAAERGIDTMVADDIETAENAFDIVVEASGSESGFASALDLVRPRGKIVLKSTFSGMPKWEAWRVVVDEITIVGSRCGRFGPALELMGINEFRLDPLISAVYPLAEALDAMKHAEQKGVLKVLLTNAK